MPKKTAPYGASKSPLTPKLIVANDICRASTEALQRLTAGDVESTSTGPGPRFLPLDDGERIQVQCSPNSPVILEISKMSTKPSGGSGATSYWTGVGGTGRPNQAVSLEMSVMST